MLLGMRVSELVSLNYPDVNFEDDMVRCAGKGGKERLIPFGGKARDAVERYVKHGRAMLCGSRNQAALFLNHHGERLTRQGFWLIIKSYAKQAGIEKLHTTHAPSQLRHPSAEQRRRSALGPGVAWSLQYRHYPGVYPCCGWATATGLRRRPSARP